MALPPVGASRSPLRRPRIPPEAVIDAHVGPLGLGGVADLEPRTPGGHHRLHHHLPFRNQGVDATQGQGATGPGLHKDALLRDRIPVLGELPEDHTGLPPLPPEAASGGEPAREQHPVQTEPLDSAILLLPGGVGSHPDARSQSPQAFPPGLPGPLRVLGLSRERGQEG